jgi:hypothetical protein
MLSGCNKYLNHFLLRSVCIIGFIFAFAITAIAQTTAGDTPVKTQVLNPLLFSAFKKPLKANPLLSEYIKPSKYELMYWPNFPLTVAQVEARDREWKTRNKKTIGGQIVSDIASDIIKNSVNSLIYGKKMPVAVTPKF